METLPIDRDQFVRRRITQQRVHGIGRPVLVAMRRSRQGKIQDQAAEGIERIEGGRCAVLNPNPGAVQVIAKVAACPWATVKALLMQIADRRMSKLDLDRARVNFEEIEWRTAKRVLEFHKARRNRLAQAPLPGAPSQSVRLQAAAG
jgi:hypothetical protein